MDDTPPVRVLQVLATTDATSAGHRALDLHGALARAGLEVRTVALGPGRRAGLERLVPVLSPSPRSLAARTQLRRERRWADVVAVHGTDAARVVRSALLRGGPPWVVVVDDRAAAGGLAADPAVPATVVLVTAGVGSGAPPPGVTEVAEGVDLGAVPTSPAARAAARELMGLPAAGVVATVVSTGAAPGSAERWTVRLRAAGAAVPEPDGADAEVLAAAVDVVAWPGGDVAVPPRDLLRAMAAGAVAVVGNGPAVGHLVDGAVAVAVPAGGDPAEALADAADPAERWAVGERAAAVVRDLHDVDRVATRWVELLAGVTA